MKDRLNLDLSKVKKNKQVTQKVGFGQFKAFYKYVTNYFEISSIYGMSLDRLGGNL